MTYRVFKRKAYRRENGQYVPYPGARKTTICHVDDIDEARPDGVTNYTCNDCGETFDEFAAANASLDPDEFNPACPNCGGDYVYEVKP